MSALHHSYVQVPAGGTGHVVYTGTSVEHAVRGWTRPAGAQVPVFIPAQRRSNDDLGDLATFAQIPQLGAFVRELLAKDQHAKEPKP